MSSVAFRQPCQLLLCVLNFLFDPLPLLLSVPAAGLHVGQLLLHLLHLRGKLQLRALLLGQLLLRLHNLPHQVRRLLLRVGFESFKLRRVAFLFSDQPLHGGLRLCQLPLYLSPCGAEVG